MRLRFAAFSTAMFVAAAGVFLLSASAAQAICFPSHGSNSANERSWAAGGQAGYNWQQGSFVYGFETDLSATDLMSSMSGGLTNLSCADIASTNANVDWYGTVRGQTIAISDIRLKRDITLVGRLDDGLGLYQYRYLWSDTIYVGVMAQEVALIHPEAILRGALDDYLRVDYARLGLRLMTLPEWDARSKSERL